MLWFAFKIVLLTYLIHPFSVSITLSPCCDVLSKLYFWHIWYTIKWCIPLPGLLWFAFKIVLLTYLIHLRYMNAIELNRCDLLSKLYFWHIWYTFEEYREIKPYVVICFQNCTFDISDTPLIFFYDLYHLLWFAFKIVLLTYLIHQIMYKVMYSSNLGRMSGLKKSDRIR